MVHKLETIINDFSPINLEEMSNIRLMNRTDTKFLTNLSTLKLILEDAGNQYYSQEIEGKRIATYRTTYWDTNEHTMYLIHHNKKLPRKKVRVRTYEDSCKSFLEVKNKDNHRKTFKKRISIQEPDFPQKGEGEKFLTNTAGFSFKELHPTLQNRFHRITLVNKAKTERLTIDFDIHFNNIETGIKGNTKNLVIIELKRDGLAYSPIKEILLNRRVKPHGMSKYCIGMAMTNPNIKKNNFKRRLGIIQKLNQSS